MKIIQITENISHTAKRIRDIEKEKGVTPGTPEWFKLWFSLPYLKESVDEVYEAEATEMKISDLTISDAGMAIAQSAGGGSRTDAPLTVTKLPSGHVYLVNGYHRLIDAMKSGKDTVAVKYVPYEKVEILWKQEREDDIKYGKQFNEEVEVSLHGDAKKGYTLSKIEVSGDERNAGQGTKAMQDIVDRMDKEGAIIALTPDDAFGGNKNRLIKFYKRFGFVPNKGRNKDFRFRETMIRYPQTNESVNEETGEEMLSIFQDMHHDAGANDEMDAFIKSHDWKLTDFTPDMFPSEEEFFDYDDPFGRVIDIDYHHRVDMSQPIIVGPQYKDGKYSVIDGNHRAAKATELGKTIKGYFPYPQTNVEENFADGKKKGKSRPGRVKRSGASCNGSVTELRAKAKKASGEKAKMYHWCANMKAGKKK